MTIFRITTAALFVAATAGAGAAQGFDPRQGCVEVLQGADKAKQGMIAAWTFGYLAASTQNVRPVDGSNNEVMIRNLANACQANPQVSLLDLVSASRPQGGGDGGGDGAPIQPGSEADAKRLLSRFVEPGADVRALTQAILPTREDVMAVYRDPLASAIWEALEPQLTPDLALGPKPGQTEVIVVHTTTARLAAQDPVLGKFPGGYEKVLPFFKADVPIVRYRFVKPGETSGFSFDGLIYVNGDWTLIPKPWRAVP